MATTEPAPVLDTAENNDVNLDTSTAETALTPASDPTPSKPIHSLVLDTGPLIKNDPPVSTLLAQAYELYTLPSVVSEIRDAATRSRVETTLVPFLKLRNPKPASIKFVSDFARKTGDLEVLSRPDIHLIALTYELECERNGGDWRLRRTPGQKGLNGKPTQEQKPENVGEEMESVAADDSVSPVNKEEESTGEPNISTAEQQEPVPAPTDEVQDATEDADDGDWAEVPTKKSKKKPPPTIAQAQVTQAMDSMSLEPSALPTADFTPDNATTSETKAQEEEDDDDDGWITPSNLKKHQEKDQLSAPEQPIQRFLQVALLTSDYAMQNVMLRMNLNLVSPSLARITRVKTWVLRCHGCFQVTREMGKQFCPKCGQPTLTRVSCSTDQSGNFTLHLKRNFQWNNRGNVYSVPKPTHGTPTGKMRGPGGGKGGWGRELILAEDQKEYVKKADEQRKARTRDLMDEDYLPSILTGNRQSGPGRIKVGAGRNVNSKKRHG